jgi:Zn-dependent protease with chaperone function
VLLFGLAVIAIVAAVDVVALAAFGTRDGHSAAAALVLGTVGSLAVIGCASLFRIASLRTGGAAVAHQFNGTPVPEDTTDFNLRRLRNVVEEIAIASGVPVPQLYVLDDESAINAFAAGYAPSDAAIAVTRGALTRLNRDELQGVIAHEFSHVLNGDMRLNIRLIGLLFGILVLSLIGRRILMHGRFSRSKDAAPVMLIALALVIIGYVGMFFGRLIKAGLSRQREYLADASAVQFTRQTTGLAGALKKLAGLPEGSKLGNSDAEEVSHMLFGQGLRLSSMMATHPPLFDRIKALDPSFKPEMLAELHTRWQHNPPVGMDEDAALGLGGGRSGMLPGGAASVSLTPPGVIAQVGAPQPDDYRRAGSINNNIPEVLQDAVRHQADVVPMLYGRLHSPPGPARDAQQHELRARTDLRVAEQSLDYAERMEDLNPMLRLPLAALAFPQLRRRPRAELRAFMDNVYALVHADGQVSLFEYCLGRLLQSQVAEAIDPSRAWVPGDRRLGNAEITQAVVTLLAVLAQAGHEDSGDAGRAYIAGLSRVYPRLNSPYAPPADRYEALDRVWPKLDHLEPMGKELLLEGLVAAISHDGQVSVAEAELLRTVCAALHCPLPPMLDIPDSRLS